MLKYLFAFVLLMHGVIHFMGFAKAFGYGNITLLTKEITRPAGMLWLLTALLYIVAFIIFLLKKDNWALIVIIASVLSQLLIILSWKDAKYGTVANVIILVIAIIAFANSRFNSMVMAEAKMLITNTGKENRLITEDDIAMLPPVVKRWLSNSGIRGKENIYAVRLRQKGEMRTKPAGKWMPFEAVQYFNPETCSFIWQTKVEMMPFIFLNGRDKLVEGKGAMLIRLLSLFNVANVSGNDKTNSAAMTRYLAEICWFPSAALAKNIRWETLNLNAAKACMQVENSVVSGIFYFDEQGDVAAFSADRYYGSDKNAKLEKWMIKNKAFQEINGIRIPTKSTITWKLDKGDFNWLNIEVTAIEFNKPFIYE